MSTALHIRLEIKVFTFNRNHLLSYWSEVSERSYEATALFNIRNKGSKDSGSKNRKNCTAGITGTGEPSTNFFLLYSQMMELLETGKVCLGVVATGGQS